MICNSSKYGSSTQNGAVIWLLDQFPNIMVNNVTLKYANEFKYLAG